MRYLRQFVGVVMLGLTFGAPAMACLVAGTEMSAPERECCKQMAERCGSMKMPSSQSCCQTEVQHSGPMLHVEPTHVAPQVVAAMIVSAPIIGALDSFPLQSTDLHPPPESPPGSSNILRI